jgi:spore maturation protein SpmA
MSVENDFHSEFGTCSSAKFATLSVKQHIKRIFLCVVIIATSIVYLSMTSVLNLFSNGSIHEEIIVFHSLLTFFVLLLISVSICRLFQSLKSLASIHFQSDQNRSS